MDEMEGSEKRKTHRKALSGRKAVKKKSKNPHEQEMTAKQRNPKAFAIQSAVKAQKKFRRTMDIQSKRYHVPTVDRTPVKPPPAIVAIVGPPKVGKTTLLRCMIKNFTKQNMSSIKGPVTLVSGKKKRLTLIECNNDINNMIDIAKVADLVLLLIDAKSGFEMETFEFLNICQAHGMPRVMGVLTHLDLFKNKKALQKTKTILKKRYRTEIPRGEKMFYLSGLLHGEYLKNEVHNLGRFISVMKFFASSWQKSHPYVLADRFEDITNPEMLSKDSTCNRTVCLYGYSRGGALKKNSMFHIPGCGDYFIKNVHFLPDPCPLPDKKKRRSLNERERLIYAPMCGVGGVVYDKDAVYIEMKGSQLDTQNEEIEKPSNQLVSSLISMEQPMDDKLSTAELSLFSNSEPLTEKDIVSTPGNLSEESSYDSDEEDSSDEQNSADEDLMKSSDNENISDEDNSDDDNSENTDEEEEEKNYDEEEEEKSENMEQSKRSASKKRKKVHFADDSLSSLSDDDGEDPNTENSSVQPKKKKKKIGGQENENDDTAEMGHLKWKDQLVQKAADAFYKRQQETVNLQKIVYGKYNKSFQENSVEHNPDSEDLAGGLFRLSKSKGQKKEKNVDDFDCSKFTTEVSRDWSIEEEMEAIRDCFVTGKWAETEDAEHLLQEDDEMYGDFEDLEGNASEKNVASDDVATEVTDNDEDTKKQVVDEKTMQQKRMEKKMKLKELFNAQFDDKEGRSYHDDLKMEVDEQGELNRKEFENLDEEIRVQYEGYRPGMYLRLEVERMPCEFINNFDPGCPAIIGALLHGEDKMGYLQVRIKKHRWYPKILKSHDPLIISLGWRRFQTIPLYYITDHNGRNRLLKYTPKHLHCMASFWGPITPQKTGLCAVQSVSEVMSNFRIAAIGAVMEVNKTTDIVKKLKLVGTPFEIFRKTAFIEVIATKVTYHWNNMEGMFHSPLEVVKYEGAAIRTVSGIRGQIKKALRKPPGIFRATFEDKILMSDIVFLRTWIKVEVPQFYISLCTLLLPPEQKSKWQGMRTLGRLRYEQGLHAPLSEDSLYTPIERKLRHFAPLVVPKNIQKELPFKDKIVHKQKKKDADDGRVAVIREPHETEIANVLNMLKTVHKMKTQKENRSMWLRARAHRKEKRKAEAIHHKKLQQKKKRILQRKKVKVDS